LCNIYLAEGNVVRRLRLYCPRAKMSDASLPARAQCSSSSVFFTVIILSSDKDLGELVDKPDYLCQTISDSRELC